MSEVEGVHNGTFDYIQLKGDTGPLVYPGGFVLVFYLLYWLTDQGKNIYLAQFLFLFLYVAVQALVFAIYKHSQKIPVWVIVLLCLSKRIHSIFILRLFNDTFAMFFLYLAIYFFLKDRWSLGCFSYSFAVGIKMNIFLFAPGLLLLLLRRFGVFGTIPKLGLCAAVQLVLALPFLVTNPMGYITRAFDLSRVFIYFWSVNWQFISESLFLSPQWGFFLLGLTIFFWSLFCYKKWLCRSEKLRNVLTPGKNKTISSHYLLWVLFTSNLIGVIFSRSLHYQFYVWYFHTIPFLLWTTSLYTPFRLAVMLCIEISWNVYPARMSSSLLLFSCHMILLFALWFSPPIEPYSTLSKIRH
eukprot:TRINITY_DN1109_c0_g1_i2.p1 TRINITY_DN1109_c0_g1~~TRINITY_DN1109_c0_g1_i2.p1  ORF type:complete len:355 (+),score=20.03 TRINITY_DN1109_c0_g1_i2:206-1270(+)